MEKGCKIGFHIRCIEHYQGLQISGDEFTQRICTEISTVMDERNLDTLFMATLCQPIIDTLQKKYNVICNDYGRSSHVTGDWTGYENTNGLDAITGCLIDTYCLAACDVFYGGSSNIVLFAGCINPQMEINLLPLLSGHDGW